MDKQEILATIEYTKYKTKTNKTNNTKPKAKKMRNTDPTKNTTQKTKKMSNTDPPKKHNTEN